MPPLKKAAAAKKPSPKKPTPKKPSDDVVTPAPAPPVIDDSVAVAAAVVRSEHEARARHAVAQRIIDEGKQIITTGQEADGRHYFVTKAPDSDETQTVYVELAEGAK